jgi:hypothetical protein
MGEDIADAFGPLAVEDPILLMRLRLLRIAADISPRVTGGVRAQDVIERARAFEVYVAGPPLGSAPALSQGDASGPADTERGAPEATESESDPEA